MRALLFPLGLRWRTDLIQEMAQEKPVIDTKTVRVV